MQSSMSARSGSSAIFGSDTSSSRHSKAVLSAMRRAFTTASANIVPVMWPAFTMGEKAVTMPAMSLM